MFTNHLIFGCLTKVCERYRACRRIRCCTVSTQTSKCAASKSDHFSLCALAAPLMARRRATFPNANVGERVRNARHMRALATIGASLPGLCFCMKLWPLAKIAGWIAFSINV